jgi:glycosyltransferase involved in cell wall biosynthesis
VTAGAGAVNGLPRRRAAERPAAERRPLRVTHVIHCLAGGGMEILVAAMARGFRESAIRTTMITLDGHIGTVGADLRADVEAIIPHRSTPFWSMIAPVALEREIRRTRPDVVHLYSGAWYKGALASRLAGVKRVVYTEHGLQQHDHPLAPLLFRVAAALTDEITTVSDGLRDFLVSRIGVPATRVRTIENGVDLDRFTPGDASPALRVRLKIPPDATVVGTVGRLEVVKAYDNLIRAVAMLPRSDLARPTYLIFCGDGSQRPALESLARDLGVGERVRFAGWAERTVEYYRLFDVFALSSASEGAPMSLMEAMATGTAPVVTDVGAMAQIVGPALREQCVPAGNIPALTAALARTLRSPAWCEQIGLIARRRVEEHYSFARMIAEYERLYRG